MGQCRYCGISAGLLEQEHAACRDACQKIGSLLGEYFESSQPAEQLHKIITDIATPLSIREDVLRGLVRLQIAGFESVALVTASAVTDDVFLSEAQELRITELCDAFKITMKDLTEGGTAHSLARSKILRELKAGKLPTGVRIEGPTAINFQQGESLIWVFNSVTYLTLTKKIEYLGGSAGVSLRVLDGVYLRTGGYKGRRVQTEEVTPGEVGDLVLTNQNIYFKSSTVALRIPIVKILSVDQFEDGLQIIRDKANAKPEVFIFGSAWFAGTVLRSLNRLHVGA